MCIFVFVCCPLKSPSSRKVVLNLISLPQLLSNSSICKFPNISKMALKYTLGKSFNWNCATLYWLRQSCVSLSWFFCLFFWKGRFSSVNSYHLKVTMLNVHGVACHSFFNEAALFSWHWCTKWTMLIVSLWNQSARFTVNITATFRSKEFKSNDKPVVVIPQDVSQSTDFCCCALFIPWQHLYFLHSMGIFLSDIHLITE